MRLNKTQISRQIPDVVQHSVHATCLIDAEAGDNNESAGHDNGLDQIHGGNGAEAAYRGIADDDHRADDHRQKVIPAEQTVEQLADGGQAGGHIRDKEDQDNQRCDAHDHRLLFPIALGNKRGNGDGVQLHTVTTNLFGYQQEVQIGAHSQANSRPARVSHATEIGQAGQSHQQPGTHVRCFGAHGSDQRSHTAPAQVKALGAFLAPPADHNAGENHETKVQDNSCHDCDLCGCHCSLSFNVQCLISYHTLR